VDATCFCTRSLDGWLWQQLVQGHYVIWDRVHHPPPSIPTLNFAYAVRPSEAFRAAIATMPDQRLYGCCNDSPPSELHDCEMHHRIDSLPPCWLSNDTDVYNGVSQLYRSGYLRILQWVGEHTFTGVQDMGHTFIQLPAATAFLRAQCPEIQRLGKSGTKLIADTHLNRVVWIQHEYNSTNIDRVFRATVELCPFQKLSTKVVAEGIPHYNSATPLESYFAPQSKLMYILNH
jgi:hypothetical protein